MDGERVRVVAALLPVQVELVALERVLRRLLELALSCSLCRATQPGDSGQGYSHSTHSPLLKPHPKTRTPPHTPSTTGHTGPCYQATTGPHAPSDSYIMPSLR